MIGERSIRLRMIFYLMTAFLAFFIVLFASSYFYLHGLMMQTTEINAKNIAAATASKIESILNRVEAVPQTIAGNLGLRMMPEEELLPFLKAGVEKNPEIYGSAAAFEPDAYKPAKTYFAPYYHRSGEKLELVYMGGDAYKYFLRDWYQIPKEVGHPVWSEPYFDRGGGDILMTTYSVPFFSEKEGRKVFGGVVTADISLSWLQKLVSAIRIGKTGYGFVISNTGRFIIHPSEKLIMNKTIFSEAEQTGDRSLREIGKRMIRGESGYVEMKDVLNGQDGWLVYVPLPFNGWSFGAFFPYKELMADVKNLNRMMIALGAVCTLVLLVLILLVSNSVTFGLRKLSEITGVIASGDLDFEMPRSFGKDEVGRLAQSIVFMRDSLKDHIRRLTETTVAKEKIESELRIAHEIQMSMLPKIFPPFPHRKELDIFGILVPTKEVGGDFYDFFFLDEEHLCVIIGDVSGKGVPASLFMAVVLTLVKTVAKGASDPAEILGKLNQEVWRDNQTNMFVTVFCGVLDVTNGKLRYATGGHNPPLIIRTDAKRVERLESIGGTIVGIMGDVSYKAGETVLRPKDTILMYTDGVTDAANEERVFFSEARLQAELLRYSTGRVNELIQNVFSANRSFTGKAPQFDDMTLLALRYYGK